MMWKNITLKTKNITLKTKLLGSFASMGAIVLVVALLGWNGSSKLNRHIKVLGDNSLPSVSAWKSVSQGLTAVSAAEQALLNPQLDQVSRKLQVQEINAASRRIDEGFKQAEVTKITKADKPLYDKFIQDWKKWKQNHEQFMTLNQEFERLGILNPSAVQIHLLSQDKAKSPELVAARIASSALDKLYAQEVTKNLPSFLVANDSVQKLVKLNEQVGEQAKKQAYSVATQNSFLLVIVVIVGPACAIALGVVLSNAITRSINATVGVVASSSTQIAATLQQQERTIAQQASSVQQTTTTMDELDASSRASTEQAEASAAGARQALTLAEGGTVAVQRTMQGMSTLKEKVGAIAIAIVHLSEQTNQIGGISGLVRDLASQTNMLALNAAVEAARAGEHGKGFGVVAEEIRKLADQSKKSADKINALVTDIQAAINSTVTVTDQGTKTVDEGIQLAQGTAETFTSVADAIDNIFLMSQQISLSTKQQAIAVQHVADAMNSINMGAKESAIGITQIRDSTEQLHTATQKLKAAV